MSEETKKKSKGRPVKASNTEALGKELIPVLRDCIHEASIAARTATKRAKRETENANAAQKWSDTARLHKQNMIDLWRLLKQLEEGSTENLPTVEASPEISE